MADACRRAAGDAADTEDERRLVERAASVRPGGLRAGELRQRGRAEDREESGEATGEGDGDEDGEEDRVPQGEEGEKEV